MRFILNITLLLFAAISVSAQKINVDTEIDSVQILVGEQTEYRVGVTVKNGQSVQFPQLKPQGNAIRMITPGVEVVDQQPQDTQKIDDDFIKITAHYILTSFDDTLYRIPGQTVVVDGKKYEGKAVALKVLTIPVDTLHPNKFFPAKDVQDNPFLWSEWSQLLWLGFLIFVLYGLCILAYIRLKSEKPIVFTVRIVKRIPPHQKALNSIDEIKSQKQTFTVDDSKLYYTNLTDTLRKYMMERFGFNAMEMTSAEIIARLRQEEDQQKIEELTMLFETADLVKFAKYATEVNENDRNLLYAVDFINNTKQDNVPTEERIKPTVTEAQRQTIRTRISLKWALGIMAVTATALVVYILYQIIILLS